MSSPIQKGAGTGVLLLVVIIAAVVFGAAGYFLSRGSGITDSGVLAIMTSAVAAGTIFSGYASWRLAKAATIETNAVIQPRVAIRWVYRIQGESRRVHLWIQNVGVGTADHVVIIATAGATTLRKPEAAEAWWILGISQTRKAILDLPDSVTRVNIMVEYADLLGNKLRTESADREIKLRRRAPGE